MTATTPCVVHLRGGPAAGEVLVAGRDGAVLRRIDVAPSAGRTHTNYTIVPPGTPDAVAYDYAGTPAEGVLVYRYRITHEA